MKTIPLIIPMPVPFYAQQDENHFFRWLKKIDAVRSVRGTKYGVQLTLSEPLDDGSLYDLIAIMKRYSLDLACLRPLCTPDNASWFKNRRKYWYKAVFGERMSIVKAAQGQRRPHAASKRRVRQSQK